MELGDALADRMAVAGGLAFRQHKRCAFSVFLDRSRRRNIGDALDQ